MANDFTPISREEEETIGFIRANRWVKEEADGTKHEVTVTEETIAPPRSPRFVAGTATLLEEYGKCVTVSQFTSNLRWSVQNPDVVIVNPENSHEVYDAARVECMERLEGRGFKFEGGDGFFTMRGCRTEMMGSDGVPLSWANRK
jgi:hypothetical protein